MLDIARAYPAEAAVKSWQRSVSLAGNAVKVTERYELAEWKAPTRLMLMTVVEPTMGKPGRVTLGNCSIDYNPSQLEVTSENISHLLDPLLVGVWGKQMFRIVLTVKSTAQKGTVSYTVRRSL